MLRKLAIGSAAAAFIAVAGIVSGSAPANAGVHVSVGIPGFFGFWAPGYYYAPPPPVYYRPYASYRPYAYYRPRYYAPRYYARGYYGRRYYAHDHDGRYRRHNWR